MAEVIKCEVERLQFDTLRCWIGAKKPFPCPLRLNQVQGDVIPCHDSVCHYGSVVSSRAYARHRGFLISCLFADGYDQDVGEDVFKPLRSTDYLFVISFVDGLQARTLDE